MLKVCKSRGLAIPFPGMHSTYCMGETCVLCSGKHTTTIIQNGNDGLGMGSAVESICCPCRGARFPAPTGQTTALHHSSSRASSTLFGPPWAPGPLVMHRPPPELKINLKRKRIKGNLYLVIYYCVTNYYQCKGLNQHMICLFLFVSLF